VLWNETYVQVSNTLEPGTVIAIRGTVDRRDDAIRATAQKVKVLSSENIEAPEATVNGIARAHEDAPITLRFGVGAGADELRVVRQILASSPGSQPVTLVLKSFGGETVRIDTGERCRIALTPAIEGQLARWLWR
jgi:hypothetical protein